MKKFFIKLSLNFLGIVTIVYWYFFWMGFCGEISELLSILSFVAEIIILYILAQIVYDNYSLIKHSQKKEEETLRCKISRVYLFIFSYAAMLTFLVYPFLRFKTICLKGIASDFFWISFLIVGLGTFNPGLEMIKIKKKGLK
ncbi:MAG: hypothetical protein PHE59_01600 [Patescibacteria group bacterium]|nr:hypothetical protein [Patescibacteria group bacterium]MDD5164497.1 hypothetical protein [Patescibacteria group bacterium]MDD5534147.1 hypothetical protein [Patescibacteria group bacterium]